MRRSRKPLCVLTYRGFESPPLRHLQGFLEGELLRQARDRRYCSHDCSHDCCADPVCCCSQRPLPRLRVHQRLVSSQAPMPERFSLPRRHSRPPPVRCAPWTPMTETMCAGLKASASGPPSIRWSGSRSSLGGRQQTAPLSTVPQRCLSDRVAGPGGGIVDDYLSNLSYTPQQLEAIRSVDSNLQINCMCRFGQNAGGCRTRRTHPGHEAVRGSRSCEHRGILGTGRAKSRTRTKQAKAGRFPKGE